MSDQYNDLEVETFDRTDMRDIVASKVKNLRKQFKLIPLKFERFNLRLAAQLKKEWEIENKEYVKKNKSEKPLVRLERWKAMSRSYRSKGIAQLSENWYEGFWRLRADMALIVALYEFSEIDQISRRKEELKTEALKNLKPIALRMKGPRKPSKKKILLRDISYDVEDAFLTMVHELEIKTIETRDLISKLVAPTKKLAIKTKIKRFQDAVLTREYITLITQAVAPRQGMQDSEYNNNSTN
ncbi:MAG: hypothetical protein GPJ54_00400 [Candidatus Heimdallarchaeota archaeon]|nr:hypothetical protein [Candidatus Heimdallarchaeota archaeon]